MAVEEVPYRSVAYILGMNARALDIVLAIGSFLVFLILLITLPFLMNQGIAYLIALIGFIVIMSVAGFRITGKIT